MLHLNILSECLDGACTLANLDPGNLVYRVLTAVSHAALPLATVHSHPHYAGSFKICRVSSATTLLQL